MRTKEQLKEYARAYHAANKIRLNVARTLRSRRDSVYQKGRLLKHRYGLSSTDYGAMLARQTNKCLICLGDQSSFSRAFAVDHDHRTGKIRGLLCIQCNGGLGNFHDDAARLNRAIEYLREKNNEQFNQLVSR